MPLPVAVCRKVEWTNVWSRLIFVVEVIALLQPVEPVTKVKVKVGENDGKPVNSSRLLEPAHLCLPAHSLTNHQPSCIGRNKRIWKYWIFFTIHFNVLQEPIKQTETICLSQGTSANKRERFAQDNCLATQSRTLIKLWLSSHSSAKHMFWRRVGQRAALEEEEEPPGFLAFCVLIGRKPPQTDVKTTFSRLQSPQLCICRTKVPMKKAFFWALPKKGGEPFSKRLIHPSIVVVVCFCFIRSALLGLKQSVDTHLIWMVSLQ